MKFLECIFEMLPSKYATLLRKSGSTMMRERQSFPVPKLVESPEADFGARVHQAWFTGPAALTAPGMAAAGNHA
jgi:hypothetical protein